MEFSKETEFHRQEEKSLTDVKFKLVEEKLLVKKEVSEIERKVDLYVVPDYTTEILLDLVCLFNI